MFILVITIELGRVEGWILLQHSCSWIALSREVLVFMLLVPGNE